MMHRKRSGRPKFQREVTGVPDIDYFKPRGIPLVNLQSVTLSVEELEAVRLVDFESMEHEMAAEKMNVSRKTLWRDLKSSRKKIADALINGKAIEIKGGSYVVRKE